MINQNLKIFNELNNNLVYLYKKNRIYSIFRTVNFNLKYFYTIKKIMFIIYCCIVSIEINIGNISN